MILRESFEMFAPNNYGYDKEQFVKRLSYVLQERPLEDDPMQIAGHVECQTIHDLENIRGNIFAFYIEAIMKIIRYLKGNNKEILSRAAHLLPGRFKESHATNVLDLYDISLAHSCHDYVIERLVRLLKQLSERDDTDLSDCLTPRIASAFLSLLDRSTTEGTQITTVFLLDLFCSYQQKMGDRKQEIEEYALRLIESKHGKDILNISIQVSCDHPSEQYKHYHKAMKLRNRDQTLPLLTQV